MNSKAFVVNCPWCEAELEASSMTGGMQCPFCDKKFNVEDAKKTRNVLMKKQMNSFAKTAKYCAACGRKLAYDARFCDWCGARL